MKNHWLENKHKKPFGIGSIGDPDIKFIRKWRWYVELFENSNCLLKEFVLFSIRPKSSTYFSFGIPERIAFDDLKNIDQAKLILLDGCGAPLETWTFDNVSDVIFDILYYDDSNHLEITLGKFDLKYFGHEYKSHYSLNNS